MARRFSQEEFEAYLLLEWGLEYEQATRKEIEMWYDMYNAGRQSVRWSHKGTKIGEKGNQFLIDVDEVRRKMRISDIDGKFTFKHKEGE